MKLGPFVPPWWSVNFSACVITECLKTEAYSIVFAAEPIYFFTLEVHWSKTRCYLKGLKLCPHNDPMNTIFPFCTNSVVWVAHLEEAEKIFAVFQIHFFWFKVTQCSAQSWRLELLEGLQLRCLADGLLRTDRRTATVAGVPVVILFVFWCDSVTSREDQLSWQITSVAIHWCSVSSLKCGRKSNISCFTFK